MADQLRFFQKAFFDQKELEQVKKFTRDSGRSLILPYDQFIEHDCRHMDAQSDAGDPGYIMKLAMDGKYNGVAVHYGVAKRYWTQIKSSGLPLILKINGKTSIPSQKMPLSVHTSFVEDAAKIGAVGVGYTMYYGSPRQDEDLPQLAHVRQECEKYGLPLIVWAYPRGEAIDAKGGAGSSYALESAARLAMEMGATVIKSNLPKAMKEGYAENEGIPKYYREMEKELSAIGDPAAQKLERAKRVVKAASGVPVLFSGGEETDEGSFMENTMACLNAGCYGFIFGRNMWKRPYEDAMRLTTTLSDLLDK